MSSRSTDIPFKWWQRGWGWFYEISYLKPTVTFLLFSGTRVLNFIKLGIKIVDLYKKTRTYLYDT